MPPPQLAEQQLLTIFFVWGVQAMKQCMGFGLPANYFEAAVIAGFLLVCLQLISWLREYGDWASFALNGAMLILALPPHMVFCKYLWDQRPRPVVLLAALGLLSAVSLLLCQTESIRFLAGGGVVVAATMYFSMRHLKRVGLKAV